LMPPGEEVLEFVARIVGGEDAVKIVRALGDKELGDEEIARRTGLKEDVVRRTLYKLHQNLVVSLRRERDEETSRFKFFWSVNLEQIEAFIKSWKRRILRRLEAKLKYEEENQFFSCGTPGCRRYTFDEASDNLFRCPRCGQPLEFEDNSKIIDALRAKIRQLRKELSS